MYVSKYTWEIELAFIVGNKYKEAKWKNQVKEELRHGATKAKNLPSTLIIYLKS